MNKNVLILGLLLTLPIKSLANTISIVDNFANVDTSNTQNKVNKEPLVNTDTTNKEESNLDDDGYYRIALNDGVDKALLEAFAQESKKLSLNENISIPLNKVVETLQDINIENANTLVLSFDQEKIIKAIEEQGVKSFRGLNNPVLVWIVNNNGQNLELLSSNNTNTFNTSLQKASAFYNYSIVYPLGDLDDLNLVNIEKIKAKDIAAISQASKRYNCDYFVVGSMEPNRNSKLFTYTVYTLDGKEIGSYKNIGTSDKIANDSSVSIVKSISVVESTLGSEGESNATFNLVANDTDSLGEGAGFVRIKITNVNNLSDFINIQKEFVTFGFDGNIHVDNYSLGGFIIDVKTKSDKAVVDGSLRHSKLFKKVGPWVYEYTQSTGNFSDENTKIIKKTANTISGKINNL